MAYGKRVYGKRHQTFVRFTLLLVAAFLTIFGFVFQQPFQAASPASSPVATYSHGRLRDDSRWRF